MRVMAVLAADVGCVLVFALVGRASHTERVDVVGVALVAWPFLVGTVLGTVVAVLRRRPTGALLSGLVVWAGTLVVGMLLRAATGGGVELSFVVVAAIVLALFLLGWRAVAAAVRRARRTRRERPASATLS